MSYSANHDERRVAAYVDRVLKGTGPPTSRSSSQPSTTL